MIELSPHNVTDYLRGRQVVSPASALLVQPLSGGVANVVLKIFDPGGGPKLGTDTRSEGQKKRHVPDPRPNLGACLVLKQPLPQFKTAAEWLVDIDRTLIERDCMVLLSQLLPAGSVPEVLWFDEANYVLAMACAPTDAVLWKKQLLAGLISAEAAQQAGVLLAMIHSGTKGDAAVAARYGDPKFFTQQRTDPYFRHLIPQHPDLAGVLTALIEALLTARHCLIHGDFSPKNIFLVPRSEGAPAPVAKGRAKSVAPKFPLSHLLLLDFEVAFYGHGGFDVATVINHLLLKSFYHGGHNWRACMIAIDAFWQTYLHTVDAGLGAIVEQSAGHVLGALLLARVDGKSPAEYITDAGLKERIRQAGRRILLQREAALEPALDIAAEALDALAAQKKSQSPAS